MKENKTESDHPVTLIVFKVPAWQTVFSLKFTYPEKNTLQGTEEQGVRGLEDGWCAHRPLI